MTENRFLYKDEFLSKNRDDLPLLMELYHIYAIKQAASMPKAYKENFRCFREMGFLQTLYALELVNDQEYEMKVLEQERKAKNSGKEPQSNLSDMLQPYPSNFRAQVANESEKVEEWGRFFADNSYTDQLVIDDVLEQIETVKNPFMNSLGFLDRTQYTLLGAVDALYALGASSWRECRVILEQNLDKAIHKDQTQLIGQSKNDLHKSLLSKVLKYRDVAVVNSIRTINSEKDTEFAKLVYYARLEGYYEIMHMVNREKPFPEEILRNLFESFDEIGLYIPGFRFGRACVYEIERKDFDKEEDGRRIEMGFEIEKLGKKIGIDYGRRLLSSYELPLQNVFRAQEEYAIGAVDCLHDMGAFENKQEEENYKEALFSEVKNQRKHGEIEGSFSFG